MRFIEKQPLAHLKPASYNPRRISPGGFDRLKASLVRFGVVKPLILNGPSKIAAGHQRLKACQALGMKTAPVIVLNEVSRDDEIQFNLLHNRAEASRTPVWIESPDDLPLGYSPVRWHRIGHDGNRNPRVVTEISRLILSYGPWGNLVVDEEGRAIENADFALAARLLRQDLLIYKMDQARAEEFRPFIEADYGCYDFSALDIRPHHQHLCQMHRLQAGAKRQNHSGVYEQLVMPRLKPDDRLLDFGAGRCAYVRKLRQDGYRAFAYEPHFVEGGREIDADQVVTFIKDIEQDIHANGLYDVLVLDGVLNSITSTEFERHVLAACNALLRPGGVLCLGTRSLDFITGREAAKMPTLDAKRRYLQFRDPDNFAVSYRGDGVWTVQRFHTAASLHDLLSEYFGSVEVIDRHRADIYAICAQPVNLTGEVYRQALEAEFNMELPGGLRHNAHKGLVEAVCQRLSDRS